MPGLRVGRDESLYASEERLVSRRVPAQQSVSPSLRSARSRSAAIRLRSRLVAGVESGQGGAHDATSSALNTQRRASTQPAKNT